MISRDEMRAAQGIVTTAVPPSPAIAWPRRLGAAALAAAMQERDRVSDKSGGLILSGGNIDFDLFQRWAALAARPTPLAIPALAMARRNEGMTS